MTKAEFYEARAQIFDTRAAGAREHGFTKAAEAAEAAAALNRQAAARHAG